MRRRTLLATAAFVGAALFAWPALDAWFDLSDARAARAAATMSVRESRSAVPLLRDDATMRASDAMAARRAMAGTVIGRGRAGGLLIERVAPARGTPRLAAIVVQLSGPEAGVIALIDHVERQRPVMRFSQWRMEAADNGAVRFSGVLIAPWRP
jgi:hypothetical protein